MITSLAEWRALRALYARRVVTAMARRFPAGSERAWQFIVDAACRQPYGDQADALRLYQDMMADIGDWSAIDRFLFTADKVWEEESNAAMDSPYARRHHASVA